MRVPLILVLFSCSAIVLSAEQIGAVRAGAVKSYVGARIIVEDVVAEVAREPQSGFTYLNFGAAWPHQVFRAVVPDALKSPVAIGAKPADVLRVTGIASLNAFGLPEIVCQQASQLEFLPAAAQSLGLLTPPAAATATPKVAPPTRTCCRTCTSGKPCGNSCIARSSTCRQPPGCAC